MATIKLWGFSASTYVRTIRMVLAEKGVTDYEQVPVNALSDEVKTPEHLARHPFGKVPVVEVDGLHLIETAAIARYLDSTLPGPRLVPSEPKDAARLDMVTSIIDSYGYTPIIAVVAYHLFPDLVGGKNETARADGLDQTKRVLGELMRIKGDSACLAGDVGVADFYLAPLMAYLTMTPDSDTVLAVPGVRGWWELISNRDSFKSTQP